MRVPGFIRKYFVRQEINAARDGKDGKLVQKVLAALDGNKRTITLLAFMVVAWAKVLGYGDHTATLGSVLGLLGWPSDNTLPFDLLVGTFSGAVAIAHALVKAYRERQAKANTVSTTGL